MFKKNFYLGKIKISNKLLFFLFLIFFLFWLSFSFLGKDSLSVFLWWLVIWLIGFIFLPLTIKFFSHFFDRGYLFSKTLGLIFLTLTLWFFSSFKILPFTEGSIWGLLLAAVGIIFLKFNGFQTVKDFKNKEIFIFEEVIFYLALLFFSFVRGHLPDIHGVEKFMDFAFLNNLLRTKFMPPVDMWLSGNTANYYYYGHYIFAFLTKITRIPSSVSYNLAVATIFAFGFSLTLSLTANLVYFFEKNIKRVFLGGFISAFLLSLGGNLHTFIYAIVLPFLKNIGLYSGDVKPYFYADPRSYIGHYPPTNDKLITEFPAYSYVLGDLHAQIIDVCFVLTFLSLLLMSFLKIIKEKNNDKNSIFYFSFSQIPIILNLSVLWMTNAWDFPIYFVVMNIIFLGAYLIKYQWNWKSAIIDTLVVGLRTLTISLLLLIPFLLRFTNPTQGIHLARLSHLLSSLYWFQLFVVWGYQFFLASLFFLFIFKKEIKPFFKNLKTGSFLKKMGLIYLNLPASDVFVFLLILCAIGLVWLPEFFYQKDISAVDFYRANTVWKVTLQAFVLFDIVSGYIILRLVSEQRKRFKSLLLTTILSLALITVMLYPFYSLPQAYNRLKKYKGLEGTTYFKSFYPDDYRAIEWLNENIIYQPVIVEAVGESYTDFARVSVHTGLPTILGWPVHEWYWRGSFEEAGRRIHDVQEIYESTSIEKTIALLEKYKAEYIFIGTLERQQYPNIFEEKFNKLGELIFSSGNTKIYRLKIQ